MKQHSIIQVFLHDYFFVNSEMWTKCQVNDLLYTFQKVVTAPAITSKIQVYHTICREL